MTVEYPKMIMLKQLYGRHDEGRAAEAITPGMLIALDSDGHVIKHATAKGKALPAFAKECPYDGRGIDDNYAIDDVVFYHMAVPGDEIYALLETAADVDVGELLESAGDGTLQAFTDGDAIAESLEEVVADGVTRCKIRVL